MKEISFTQFNKDFISMINDDWALLSAGKKDDFNCMTVSWGGIGELWNKNVGFVFVRPQRYTFKYMEENEYFCLSFFNGAYKKELGLCGSVSGRDSDKMAMTGLTPVSFGDAVTYSEASVSILFRKIACQDIDPAGFIDKSIMSNYDAGDFHRVYVGEIVNVIAGGE